MRFGTILIDPPWEYSNRSKGLRGTTSHHYNVMSFVDIKKLPIPQLANEQCVLLLWTTWPHLPNAFELIETWGFNYITAIPWFKTTREGIDISDGKLNIIPNYGVGYWFRGCSEVLLVAKLQGTPSVRTNLVGIISPNATHSRKPDNVYEIAEKFPGPYLELFAREQRDGWTVIGDEVDGGRDIKESIEEIRARF